MATVRETVKRDWFAFPTLFDSIESVLHHFFFVNGNGMQWVDGELINEFQSSTARPEIGARQLQANINEAKEHGDDNLAVEYERELVNHEFTVKNFDRIYPLDWNGYIWIDVKSSNHYPICEYAKILNVPDDVKDDWLQAAYWYCHQLKINYNDYSKPHKNPEEQKYWWVATELEAKFHGMLVKRGIFGTKEEANKIVDEIIDEILAKERSHTS